LASELVQGKYPLPPSDNPNSLLARHERGLFEELQTFASKDDLGHSNHRSDAFAQNVTPRARDLIQAIGHRLAYDSVVESGTVRQELIDVWESNCVLEYAAWYIEHASMTSREIYARQVAAIERTRPHLEAIIEDFGMDKHFGSTPLVSSELEDEFMRGLPTFGEAMQGHGISSML
jgi:acyl-CoA oxidase